jgi:hypothetical protein
MKTSISALFIVAAALAALPNLAATPAKDTVDAFRLSAVNTRDGGLIVRGDTAYTVRMSLGWPQATLTPNVWLYRGYYPADESARAFSGNTLLVTFANNKVTDIHIVNSHAKAVLAARLQQTTAPVTIADIAKPATVNLP